METKKMFLLIMIVSFFLGVLNAEVSLSANIGARSARYYYLQDIEAYYDVQASKYIFLSDGQWIRSKILPETYGNFDLDNSHRVIINGYNGDHPYKYFCEHKEKFPKGQYGSSQISYWSMKDYKKLKNNSNNNRQVKEFKMELKHKISKND